MKYSHPAQAVSQNLQNWGGVVKKAPIAEGFNLQISCHYFISTSF